MDWTPQDYTDAMISWRNATEFSTRELTLIKAMEVAEKEFGLDPSLFERKMRSAFKNA